MLKVIIVEDEELLRKGLILTFDWNAMDCVIVGEAENGLLGLELILKLKPDIVVTDIKMPRMDGLEMLSQFSIGQFESIVMSGFEEFDYAKKAIALNVSHYLLKPIDEQELRFALVQLKEKIINKQKLLEFEATPSLNLLKGLKLSKLQYDRYTQRAMDYIESHYQETLRLRDIAEALGLSVGYLSKIFKETTSYSINDYLNRYRIQKAIEFLKTGEHKLFEIANLCGFSEYKYFHHVFTHYAKMAPKEFAAQRIFKKTT